MDFHSMQQPLAQDKMYDAVLCPNAGLPIGQKYSPHDQSDQTHIIML